MESEENSLPGSTKRKISYRRVFLTGGSSGIGFNCLLKLLRRGHSVIAPCRDKNRSQFILNSIENEPSLGSNYLNSCFTPIVDLSDLESLERCVSNLISEGLPIDSLVLNAGLQYTGAKKAKWSSQGIELTFAVNHLSHQYLTQRLLRLLYKSNSPRVVITASEVHNPNAPGGRIGEPAGLGQLNGLRREKGYFMLDGNPTFNADKAYKDSKLCNILFARELFRRLKLNHKEMPVIAWAPGLVIPKSNQGFFRYSRQYNEIGQRIFALFVRDILHLTETLDNAGDLLTRLVVDSEYQSPIFTYYSNQLKSFGSFDFKKTQISDEAGNDELANDLWEISSKIIGLNGQSS